MTKQTKNTKAAIAEKTVKTATIYQDGKKVRTVQSKTVIGLQKNARQWIRVCSGVTSIQMSKSDQIKAMKPFTFEIDKETPKVSPEERLKTINALNTLLSDILL